MLNTRLMDHAFGFCQFFSLMVLKASLIILAELSDKNFTAFNSEINVILSSIFMILENTFYIQIPPRQGIKLKMY